MSQRTYFLSILFLIYSVYCFSQEQQVISGNLTDIETKEPLGFASISLKNELVGTITNENGEFEFRLPTAGTEDTLIASYLGYEDFEIAIKEIHGTISIQLRKNIVDLKEVIVLPHPPTHYIKLAMSKLEHNYPTSSFNTTGYFSEKILENNEFIIRNEAVFETHYPTLADSGAKQNQLLLFRKEKNPNEISFMKDQVSDLNKKEEKKAIKKGKTDVEEYAMVSVDDDTQGMLQLNDVFGGPSQILSMGKIGKGEFVLDSTMFKKFEYSFNHNSHYQGNQLMVIDFESKRAIEKIKSKGSIFIDIATDAIVAIDYYGAIRMPVALKPLLFAMGINLEKPTIEFRRKFQQKNNIWYPQDVILEINISISKSYWFKKDEHAHFQFKQVFNVNELEIQHPQEIAIEKRFDPNKTYEEQIYNDENIKWSDVNIMAK